MFIYCMHPKQSWFLFAVMTWSLWRLRPLLESPWRNLTNRFHSCLVPLSCTHSELQKVPPLTQLRSYVTKGGRVGAQILCFWFFHPRCLTSPLWEDHTILNPGGERSRTVLFLWPSSGLSPFGSLMCDINWDLRPSFQLDMNHELVFWGFCCCFCLCFCFPFPPEAKINSLGIYFLSRVTLDIQGFLRSSVVFLVHFLIPPLLATALCKSLLVSSF